MDREVRTLRAALSRGDLTPTEFAGALAARDRRQDNERRLHAGHRSLLLCAGYEPMTSAELAPTMGRSPRTVTLWAAPLVELGLLRREHGGLRLTPAGEEYAASLYRWLDGVA